ncbi:MAG: family 10 glycosylhydrolase [Archangium sp.]
MKRVVPVLVVALWWSACGPPPVPQPDASVELDGGGNEDAGTTSDAGAGTDAGSMDAGRTDAGMPDAGRPDGGSDGGNTTMSLVTVSSQRELRGVWLTTVQNLDWPSSQSLSADAGKAQLANLVDSMADAGLNALFFQVRPESDAVYESTIEPWSRFLTGTQGRDPGWDPLDELLTLAHARGIEVHAWMNPYRGLTSTSVVAAQNHVTRTLSTAAITYNGAVVMNPGELAVRQHFESVVQDLLTRYDVDGLHFDDYFYPYPDSSNTPFPDSATYGAYQADGGTMNLGDWRRDNVNSLVREVMSIITNDHPTVRFGISPFGIWRSGQPVPGLDAYAAIYCDAPTWMLNGWVDYLAPQLYWREGSAQDYSTLASWWAMKNMGGRHLFPGHAVNQLSSSGANWPLSEIQTQVEITRQLSGMGAQGDIHFRAAFIANDTKGVHGLFKNTLYAKPALAPLLPRAGASVAPAVPLLMVTGTTVNATSPSPQNVRFYALYRELGPGQWELTRVRGGPSATFTVSTGAWAVSAVARGGAESQGVRFVVP